jgi:transcriptional regulator with XRE-family HTH domain
VEDLFWSDPTGNRSNPECKQAPRFGESGPQPNAETLQARGLGLGRPSPYLAGMAAAKARTGPSFAQIDWMLDNIYAGKVELLADRLGVDQATVWRWRERLNHPQQANRKAIAQLYAASLEAPPEGSAKPRRRSRGLGLSLRALREGKKAC